MITAIIIDDDITFAKRLKEEVEIIARNRNMDMEITITDDPISCLEEDRIYDIYFIDVHMPGQTGIELAKKLRWQHNNSEFIFVSSYLRYMREAFYVAPRAYIHKENLKEELDEAFSVLEKVFRYRKIELLIKDNHKNVIVRPGDIMYLKSESHYVEIHETGRPMTVVRNSLRELEIQMKEFAFLRIHQRYLVNMNFIEKYCKRIVKMRGGEELPISAPYAKRVMDAEIERARGVR